MHDERLKKRTVNRGDAFRKREGEQGREKAPGRIVNDESGRFSMFLYTLDPCFHHGFIMLKNPKTGKTE